jgi:hypothetical protein
MYNGVKAMIDKEKSLMPPEQDVHCSNKLASPADLTGFPVFPEGTKSLLSKYLSKEVWS